MKIKPLDYLGIVLEALPCGIPLAMDYRVKRTIENDARDLLDNPEKTKALAMTARQQLSLDPQYNTVNIRGLGIDGILTRRAKESIISVLGKMEEKKREEILGKKYPALTKNIESENPELRVILPEEVRQE